MPGKEHGSSRHTKMWKVKMFEVIILIAYLTQKAATAPPCEPSAVWHTDGIEGRCCQSFTCHPGFQPKICNISGTLASCSPCPENKFNSKDLSSALENDIMPFCETFTTCEVQHQEEIRPGNSTHDRVCGCKNEFHELENEKCYSFCPPGKYWSHKNETCFPCSNGTFKDWKGTQECVPCKQCNTTDTVPCIATNDTVCLEDKETGPVAGSENKLSGGEIVGIVVGLLILGGVVAVLILCICKKKHKKWPWCKKSKSSPASPRTSPGADRAENGEAEPMLENGSHNASNHPTASGTSSRGKLGFLFCCSHQDSNAVEGRQAAGNSTRPDVNMDQRARTDCNLDEQANNPTGTDGNLDEQANNPTGTDGNLDEQANNPTRTDGNLDEQANNPTGTDGNLDQQADNPAGPDGNLDQQADNRDGTDGNLDQQADDPSTPDANLDQRADNPPRPDTNLGQLVVNAARPDANQSQPAVSANLHDANLGKRANLDQSSGDRAQPGQASVDPAQPNTFSSGGFVASPEGVLPELHAGRAPVPASSLCSNVQSPADRLPSHDTHHSSVPQTMRSDLRSHDESINFNLQPDPSPAAAESIIKTYIRVMRKRHNEILMMLYLGDYFIGHLFQEHVLTRDQHHDVLILRKQAGGKAAVLDIIEEALLRSGDKAAEPFLNALVDPDSRQDELAKIIDPERADQLIRKRDNPDEAVTPDESVTPGAIESLGSIQHPEAGGLKSIPEDLESVDNRILVLNQMPAQVHIGVTPDPKETQVKEVGSSDVSTTPRDDPGELWHEETQVKEVGSSDVSTTPRGDPGDLWHEPPESVSKCYAD